MIDVKKVAYQVREITGHYLDKFSPSYKTKAIAVSAMKKMKKRNPQYKYELEKWNPKYSGGRWVNGGYKL